MRGTTRGRLVAAIAAAAATAAAVTMVAGGCSTSGTGNDGGEVVVGFLLPQSGPYTAIGEDMRRGFDLYLAEHGNRLGGRSVRVVTADEGDGGAVARAATEKLIKKDRVSVLVGTATAPAAITAALLAGEAKIPFVGVGGRPSTLEDVRYVWHTSFLSTEFGAAIGGHLASVAGGPVYVIGPDYQGGKDQIQGFVQAFTAAGGRLANPGGRPAYTPWPGTENFGPWLATVRDAGAKAVYAFYAGAPAVAFVRQYLQFGLHGTVPLYGAGFLTEGAALTAQGPAADGVRTVMPYAAGLSNPANTAFVAAVRAQHRQDPTLYHVTAYDAAAVLDRAIAAGTGATPPAINTAIAALGEIDSPRGRWRFGPVNHTPIQRWYLREVRAEDAGRSNVVVRELATLGS